MQKFKKKLFNKKVFIRLSNARILKTKNKGTLLSNKNKHSDPRNYLFNSV